MRFAPRSLVALALILAAPIAHAAEEGDSAFSYAEARTGFQVGLRVSAQVPAGNFVSGTSLGSVLGPRLHMAFDLGSKVNPYFFIGGYLGVSYGLEGSTFSSACSAADESGAGVTCNAESADGGVVAIVTFAPDRLVDPWIGLTLGYEVQGFNYAGVTGLLTGISPTLLAGIDFRIRNREHKSLMSIGPYGGVTAQKYVTESVNGDSVESGGTPIHAWVHAGLRFTFPS